jgi:hypothetical protein
MASPTQAAKGGKKTKARKPALRVVAAPAPIVRRTASAVPNVATAANHPNDGRAYTREQRLALPGYGRDNPNCLGGEALRQFANERGMAFSEVNTMTDEKIREQLRYLTSAAYEEA